jgi:hypothetical protein
VGILQGGSSFVGNVGSGGSTPGNGTVTSSGTVSGNSFGNALIIGPSGIVSGNSVSGGMGSGANSIGPNSGGTVAGAIAINAQATFTGVLSPALTGGRASALGTVITTNTATGTGPSIVSSGNTANVFSGGQAQAANQFGSAGGLGSGASNVASGASGTSAVDPLALLSGTGTATGTFSNQGAGVFAVPPFVVGTSGNNFVGGSPLTANTQTAFSFGPQPQVFVFP